MFIVLHKTLCTGLVDALFLDGNVGISFTVGTDASTMVFAGLEYWEMALIYT